MGLSLKPEHLKRYRDVARLLMRYGRSDAVRRAGADDLADDGDAPEAAGTREEAKQLAADLEAMGPTFIKLGQLLSTRPDLLPPAYIEELARLQDRVEPFPWEEVERIVTTELGVRLSKAFATFEETPLAAASLGQVHRATLRDGRDVAVKVQRPDIRARIVDDLDAFAEIADFADRHTAAGRQYEFSPVLEEFRRSLLSELDYRREAANLATLSANLTEFDRIVVPTAVDGYTTSRVLTMEYVRGRKITALSPLARIELDGRMLAEELFRAYLKQILLDGFFHADPHAGNVFVTDDGRLALIDLGMVGQLGPELQERLMRVVLALGEGRGEEAAEGTILIGETRAEFDRPAYVQTVQGLTTQFQGATARDIQVGRLLLEVTRAAAEAGLRLPSEMTMLGRALLALDHVGRTLDPDFDPNASIRANASELMRRRMLKSVTPGNVFSSMLEANEFVQRLPGRLNRLLDALGDGELEVRIRVGEEVWLQSGLQKISNRITVGIVLAALIIGAAMLMRIPTRVTLFGYPAIAMVFFLVAAVLGLMLAFSVIAGDVHEHRSRRKGTK
jgi:ubiquinone biosynthesis protein